MQKCCIFEVVEGRSRFEFWTDAEDFALLREICQLNGNLLVEHDESIAVLWCCYQLCSVRFKVMEFHLCCGVVCLSQLGVLEFAILI